MELRLISIANYENKPFYLFNEEFQDHAAKKKKILETEMCPMTP